VRLERSETTVATPQGVQGLLGNLEHSGYVPTTTTTGDRLLNLLTLPRQGRAVIVDPTGGTGDLLRPFDGPNVDRICIEISRERAEAAQRALLDAQVINAAFEDCDLAVESISIGVANPPYFRQGTLRAEYLIIRLLTQAIMPDGILIAIIPARSAWDGVMINHVVRHYTDVQIFTVPSDEFERYTQIVVVGKKRALALEHPDPLQKDRLRAYRYKHDPQHPERSPWAAGTPPPELPTAPLLTPYRVPAAKDQPNITVRRAGETLVLRGMEASGVQHTTEWIAATTWQPDVALDQPIMPISGLAHQSALIMTDMFAGEAFQGPDGQWYTFLAHVGMEWTTVDPEDDEKAKGVTHIDQQQDHMTLSVLNLDTGDITHYQKDAVFEFLAPWLPILAERVLARYRPLYDLNPPDWLLDVACQIGLDKALPGADEPGLAIPQLHRVFAMWYALCAKGYVAMQGEPGTGKSRMHTLLMAIFAYAWANRSRLFTRATRPKWIDKLRRAWRANPRTIGDAPRALPLLVVTPKRVMPVWEGEITAAWDAIAWQDELRTRWPATEVMVIDTHHDIARWMQRCARSSAPAVIAIVSQSSTRAFGRVWRPAVIEKPREVNVPDLSPAAAERGEPIIEGGHVVGYRDPTSCNLITTTSCTPRFFCPDCGALQLGVPRSVSKPEAGQDEAGDDRLEPVESLTYFSYKPRTCCACGTPLWSDSRVPSAQRKYPQLPFAAWSQAAPQLVGAKLPTSNGKPARRHVRLTESADSGVPTTITHYDRAAGQWTKETLTCDLAPAAPDSFSPFEYLARFYHGCVAFVGIDEAHNGRSESTDIAHSIHLAMLAAQTRGYGSGTNFGGVLHGFFYYHYRLNPRFWQRLGLGWDDCDKAVRRYAFQRIVTKEFESAANRGSGQTTVVQTVQAAPGISARLIPYLLADYVYIGVPDVGANMPPREEIPVVVSMNDPTLRARLDSEQIALDEARKQHTAAREHYDAVMDDDRTSADIDLAERNLQAAGERLKQAQRDLAETQVWVRTRDLRRTYAGAEQRLSELAKQSDAAKLAKDTLLRWWSILPFWGDPRFTVTQTRKGDWGDLEGTAEIYCAPLLASDHLYPLEVQLRELVAQEVAGGRPTMIYYEQNDRRSTADRLLHVLADFVPWALANRVEAEDREAAIQAAVAAGHLVVIVPYRRVLEGLNLQCIKNVVWYELAQNLFMLDQASRRAWRLGQRDLVRIYYLVMEGTASYYKLVRLGQMNGAASLFAGDTVTNPLATFGGANKLALAKLSQRLAERAADDLAAAFQRRNAELAAELRRGTRWIGVTDTLAERMVVRRAARVMQPQLTTADEPILSTMDVGDAVPLPLELTVPMLDLSEPAPVLHSPLTPIDRPKANPTHKLLIFGNLAHIERTLRRQRTARRAVQRALAEAPAQLGLFDDPPLAAAPTRSSAGALQQLALEL